MGNERSNEGSSGSGRSTDEQHDPQPEKAPQHDPQPEKDPQHDPQPEKTPPRAGGDNPRR